MGLTPEQRAIRVCEEHLPLKDSLTAAYHDSSLPCDDCRRWAEAIRDAQEAEMRRCLAVFYSFPEYRDDYERFEDAVRNGLGKA